MYFPKGKGCKRKKVVLEKKLMLCQGKYLGSMARNTCVQSDYIGSSLLEELSEHKIRSSRGGIASPKVWLNWDNRMKEVNSVIADKLQKYNAFHSNQCLLRIRVYGLLNLYCLSRLEINPAQSEWNNSNCNNTFCDAPNAAKSHLPRPDSEQTTMFSLLPRKEISIHS